jgi:uncharacterized DUF497 family protein
LSADLGLLVFRATTYDHAIVMRGSPVLVAAIKLPTPAISGRGRYDLLGLSVVLRVLVVCHCYRSGGDFIRLISAQKANQRKREAYHRRTRT